MFSGVYLDILNLRDQVAATPAEPGAVAIQRIAGVLKQVDDQGVASTLGGGAGTVTSVAATAGGLLAVAGTPTVAPTVGMAAIAAGTYIANITGGSAVPTAVTRANVISDLGIQNAASVAITGGTMVDVAITGTTSSGGNLVVSTTSHATKGLFAVGSASTGFTVNEQTGWVGVATGTTNLGASGFGTPGITILGGTTGPAIEGKLTTTTASSKGLLTLLGYNGTVNTAVIQLWNNSSTTDGAIRFFMGSALGALYTFTSTTLTLPSTLTITMTGGGTIQTASATGIVLATNSTARITIGGTGNLGFFGATAVAQQTVGANVNNCTASGTTGQFDNWTDLTTYATDAAAIHATVSQLARSVTQLTVAVRNLGFGA